MVTGLSVTWRPPFDVNIRQILGPLRRGTGDPTYQHGADGAIWRTSRLVDGPVSYRIAQRSAREIHCTAWGPGAAELIERLPVLLGSSDNPAAFTPLHPMLTEAVTRFPGLRLGRTDRVLEALVPAILEQKVTGKEARHSWRVLVRTYGEPAPGPVPVPMWVPPTVQGWRLIPSWAWHQAGVDPQRSATIARSLRIIDSVERRAADGTAAGVEAAKAGLMAVPGIGVWTLAETAQRAWGDPDALSIGDYHLAAFVGWSLLGRKIDDDTMVALLVPWSGQRHRLVRMLELHPAAVKPRFGPRLTIQDHRRH